MEDVARQIACSAVVLIFVVRIAEASLPRCPSVAIAQPPNSAARRQADAGSVGRRSDERPCRSGKRDVDVLPSLAPRAKAATAKTTRCS